jgi:hypothetical protein
MINIESWEMIQHKGELMMQQRRLRMDEVLRYREASGGRRFGSVVVSGAAPRLSSNERGRAKNQLITDF